MSLREFILTGAAFIAAMIASTVSSALLNRRRVCPDCGRQGFRRLVSHHGDYDSTPRYVVRECKSCGMIEVECHRGVKQLPRVAWRRLAEDYVLNKPRGFEVITKDPTTSDDGKGS